MSTLLIFDGTNLLYRSHFGLPPMFAPDGSSTSATFGFISGILKATDLLKPTHRIVVFDSVSGGKNWRHDIDPTYKAHRNKPEETLVAQFHSVRKACDVLSVAR